MRRSPWDCGPGSLPCNRGHDQGKVVAGSPGTKMGLGEVKGFQSAPGGEAGGNPLGEGRIKHRFPVSIRPRR